MQDPKQCIFEGARLRRITSFLIHLILANVGGSKNRQDKEKLLIFLRELVIEAANSKKKNHETFHGEGKGENWILCNTVSLLLPGIQEPLTPKETYVKTER